MNVEDLVGMDTNMKVYEDDHIIIHLGYDKSGNIWFHHDLKKFDKTIYKNIVFILEDILDMVKQATGLDRMYSWCPNDKVFKWAVSAGWIPIGQAYINGELVDLVEYA